MNPRTRNFWRLLAVTLVGSLRLVATWGSVLLVFAATGLLDVFIGMAVFLILDYGGDLLAEMQDALLAERKRMIDEESE